MKRLYFGRDNISIKHSNKKGGLANVTRYMHWNEHALNSIHFGNLTCSVDETKPVAFKPH